MMASSESESVRSSPSPSPTATTTGPGRPKRSPVWDFFAYDCANNRSVCKVEVTATGDEAGPSKKYCDHHASGKFPTNLKNHLKKHHPAEYEEVLQKEQMAKKAAKRKAEANAAKALGPHKQLTMSEAFEGKHRQVYERSGVRYKSITKRLAVFVGSTNTPYSVVENVEFQQFVESLDPRYPMPSRTLLGKELDKVLFDLKATIHTYLSAARKVSLCADIWSKKGLTSSYLGVTAHFFSCRDHRKHRVTLAVRRLAGPHTAEHVREVVEEVMKEWEIPESKVRVIVTDNGSNMVAAFKSHFEEEEVEEEEEEVEEEDDEISDSWEEEEEDFVSHELSHDIAFASFIKRVPCFAHTLQLVVRKFDQLPQFKKALKNTHALVRKVNKSTKATEKLISLCNKKLIGDCPTRWSSTYLLVERLLNVRSSLTTVLEELDWDNLPASEWKHLENIYKLLKPFAHYTSLISGEEYTTLSAVIPIIMEINLHLEEMRKVPDLSHAAAILQSELKHRFRKYTDPHDPEHDPLFLVAALFDPRYKLLLNPSQTKSAQTEVLKQLKDLSENGSSTSTSATASPVYPQYTESDEPPLKRFCHLQRLMEEKWKEGMKKTSEQRPGEQELQQYLATFNPVHNHMDPVVFWVEQEKNYPLLSTIAIDTLIIPGSSAPIERVFSTAGNATIGKRNRLANKNLEREVLLRKNKDYLYV